MLVTVSQDLSQWSALEGSTWRRALAVRLTVNWVSNGLPLRNHSQNWKQGKRSDTAYLIFNLINKNKTVPTNCLSGVKWSSPYETDWNCLKDTEHTCHIVKFNSFSLHHCSLKARASKGCSSLLGHVSLPSCLSEGNTNTLF